MSTSQDCYSHLNLVRKAKASGARRSRQSASSKTATHVGVHSSKRTASVSSKRASSRNSSSSKMRLSSKNIGASKPQIEVLSWEQACGDLVAIFDDTFDKVCRCYTPQLDVIQLP